MTPSSSPRIPDAIQKYPHYTVAFSAPRSEQVFDWHGSDWGAVPWLEIANFRKESSAHRPRTKLKILYSEKGLYGLFRVEDRFVRAVHNGFQAAVYKDSCVECFLHPRPDAGYFNFEWNCGGSLLASYITDHVRITGGFLGWTPLSPADVLAVKTSSSLPIQVNPEIKEHITWFLEFFIPFDLIAHYVGPLGKIPGQRWRANFYKCGDETSHPHWGAWSTVTTLNFHMPQCFGVLHFEDTPHRSARI